MKDLKNYREKELSLYIISCIMLFLVMHQFIIIDKNDLPNMAETISQIFVSTVLSAIAFGFILVTECLFTSAFKEKSDSPSDVDKTGNQNTVSHIV